MEEQHFLPWADGTFRPSNTQTPEYRFHKGFCSFWYFNLLFFLLVPSFAVVWEQGFQQLTTFRSFPFNYYDLQAGLRTSIGGGIPSAPFQIHSDRFAGHLLLFFAAWGQENYQQYLEGC